MDSNIPFDVSTEVVPTIPLVGDTISLAPTNKYYKVERRTIFLFENEYAAELWVTTQEEN